MTDEMTSLGTNPPTELEKMQFDYAWKWFSFHADQRIKMFNFMLVVFGIFAAGIVNSLDKHLPKTATITLCFSAAALALIFERLDRRNRDLVWFGEDILRELERTRIFGKDEKIQGPEGKPVPFGIKWRQSQQETAGWIGDACLGKHAFWLPSIARLIAALFLMAGFWIWFQEPAHSDFIQ